MRYAALVTSIFLLVQPAVASTTPEIDPRASLSVVQQWIYNYRAKPITLMSLQPCVCCPRAKLQGAGEFGHLSRLHCRRDRVEPRQSRAARHQLLSGAPGDEWVIVRAIAYSGLPDWRTCCARSRRG